MAPLWLMCRSWARYVETQRHPATARRLAHLEGMVDAGAPDTRAAISEIARIQAWADAELDD
ncbi:hypothetical protein F4561_006251 [Lipingzhangella halophila]|uniref:Uncharacterized protein n=1 Tax=Lipingzhangella halophila TaxID=1783352 RepID=A0A7W7RNP1_9ACTN|nr:hypothetical protein [Lipingzhangella halophila]MBB4935357.1 hypothetical protein [Lipingzhangella halophila]